MGRWVKLCPVAEAPQPGSVAEAQAEGVAVCLANIGGEFSAVDNHCPHRQGPLGQGWLEGNSVVCPWHSWTFNLKTGEAESPVHSKVNVFPVKVEAGEVLVEIP